MSSPRPNPCHVLISYAHASAAIAAAVAFARNKGLALSFAIVDSAGHLGAAVRMDGAPFVTTEIARGKAFASVATGGQSGSTLGQRFRDNPMVWSNTGSLGYGAPLLPAQGSLPIYVDGNLVGAMGASGAASEVDEALISHAIASIGRSAS
jgi:glc operon protein GlcG